MIFEYLGQKYECAKAVKGADYIHLYADEEMKNQTHSFDGIADFSDYKIIDGEWSEPPLTETEEIQLALAELAEMIGGMV